MILEEWCNIVTSWLFNSSRLNHLIHSLVKSVYVTRGNTRKLKHLKASVSRQEIQKKNSLVSSSLRLKKFTCCFERCCKIFFQVSQQLLPASLKNLRFYKPRLYLIDEESNCVSCISSLPLFQPKTEYLCTFKTFPEDNCKYLLCCFLFVFFHQWSFMLKFAMQSVSSRGPHSPFCRCALLSKVQPPVLTWTNLH